MNIEPKKKTVLKIPLKKKSEEEIKIQMTDKMKDDVAKGLQKRKSEMIAKKIFINTKNK